MLMAKHPDKDTKRRILDFLKEHCGVPYTAEEINVDVFGGSYVHWGEPGDVPLPKIKDALEDLAGGRMVNRDGDKYVKRHVYGQRGYVDSPSYPYPAYRASRLACMLHRMERAPTAFYRKVRHPRVPNTSKNTARFIGVVCAIIGAIIGVVGVVVTIAGSVLGG